MSGFKYKSVVPWGRSYEEYLDMFLLSEEDLQRSILGVGDGPASFNSILSRQGGKIISVDPTYEFSTAEFKNRISETYQDVISQTKKNQHSFVWTRIKDVESLGKIRLVAMNEFCSDFESGKTEKRYIAGALPELPFQNKSFDLVLSSHLLFFYSKNLDYDFHEKAIQELIRMGNEVRIFPIVDLNSNPSIHLEPILKVLDSNQIQYSIEKVKYHFQLTGNQMLRILPGAKLLDFA